jgi:aminodeoxyfutalosine deaminase
LDVNISKFIRAMPKSELHVHLEGSIAPGLLLELAAENGLELGVSRIEDIEKLFSYRSFEDFKQLLLHCVRVLRKPEDFYRVALSMGAEFKRRNTRYAEIYWTPQFYVHLGYSLDELQGALYTAAQELLRSENILVSWIPDLVRSRPAPAMQVMGWASSARARAMGVVALGLAGPERDYPLEPFVPVFREAALRGLPANPHAGEGSSAAMVAQTIQALNPARLGHGVSCWQDRQLVREIAQRNIALEVCLSSNIQLGLFRDYAAHPLGSLLDAGCAVVLNTDDPALFVTHLSREYAYAHEFCGVSLRQLEEMALNGLRFAYLDSATKSRLLSEYRRAFDRLAVRYAC